jgi:MFS family permease
MPGLSLLTLNIANPSRERATTQLAWLAARPEHVLVPTETKASDGCRLLAEAFHTASYTVQYSQPALFAALLAPAALSLLTTTFTEIKERARAFGVLGAIVGSGAAIGLMLGGLLTEYFSWRWTLYVNDLIAIFVLAGAIAFLRRSVPANRPRLDVPGVVLVSAGLFCLVFGFANADADSWGNPMVWGFLTAGPALLLAFFLWQARAHPPLLPLRILADRDRGAAMAAVLIVSAGMFGVFLFLTYYLQDTLGYSPLRNGLAFLPMVGMVMLISQLTTNWLAPRLGPKVIIPLGLLLAAIGVIGLTRLDLHSTYSAHVLPPLLLIGAIDKRVVINPRQAERLLAGVAAQKIDGQPRRSSGPILKAFFGVMYYSALRPEEAAMLSKADLQLPESGWGELLPSPTAPIAGAAWTDSGARRDRRQLKQRARGEVRTVPSPPPLTALLHVHLTEFGTAADGRLFRSLAGGELAESTIARCGIRRARRPLCLRNTRRRWRDGRTTCGTRACPPGSRQASHRHSAPNGPVTPWQYCTRSTPRSSPHLRLPPTSASRKRSDGLTRSPERP